MSSEKSKLLKKIKGSTHILHPESTLVFRSAKDRIVIGRYENETVIELDNKTVKLCEKWNYKYDTSLIITEEAEEATEDEAEAAEEAEEAEEAEATEEAAAGGTEAHATPVGDAALAVST